MRALQHCIAEGLQDQLQQEDLCLRHLYLYEWEMFSFIGVKN